MFFGRHTCLPWLFEAGENRDIPLLAEIGGAPPFVITVGDRRRARRILARLEGSTNLTEWSRDRLGERESGRVELGVGRAGSAAVMVAESQIGGSATEVILRELIDARFHPRGVAAVLRVGTCGTLIGEGGLPRVAVATFATGWSAAAEQCERGAAGPPMEYRVDRPPDPPRVACTERVVTPQTEGTSRAGAEAQIAHGGVFSKDSLYAEQGPDFVDLMRRLGCIATEMEISTIAAVVRAPEIAFGGIMATADPVPSGTAISAEEVEANEDLAIEIALDAIRLLAPGGP
jgi:uridine phosphorylase